MGAVRIDLGGQVAVVTGGSRGIGLAVVRRFEESGARPVIFDLEPPGDGRFEWLQVDVTQPATVEAAVAATLGRHGRIDILVCSAGIHGPVAPVEEYPPEAWRRVMAVNLDGIFHTCRAVVPAMRAAGYGRIVLLASIAGKEGTPGAAAYSASKAGVVTFAKALGKELAGTGVLVDAIAPGPVDTAMIAGMPPAHVAAMLAKCPLGRVAAPEEAAALIAWLASPECSYNTGAVFDLSGGRASW
jgi:3-oxoacyl-[acyl-carrier protein] reductase